MAKRSCFYGILGVMQVIIFTDGASKGNPGPGGWGAIVATDEAVKELGYGQKRTTNNRMELIAAVEGLRFSLSLKPETTTVYSDSSYVINGATKWIYGWKRNGWMTKEKKDVLHKDLWEELSRLVATGKKIEWMHVGGHVDIPGNERADEIATAFAENKNVHLFSGPRSAYRIDLAHIAHNEEKQKEKSAARAHSNQKAFSYVSKVNGNILVHKTWDECKKRVEGKKALYKKSVSADDEAAIMKNFSARK